MNQADHNGNIVTFYSFKGGVGRTMAVANVAFLSALNGKRVLVMDWDLEAPGLAYYFRGLLDSADATALEDAPGVLDILCEWRAALTDAISETSLDVVQKRFEAGAPFEECVRSLVEPAMATTFFPSNACLDIIGAGAKTIAALNGQVYEEALAQFSWATFFDEQAGGFVLEKLRQWVKRNYDVILIDSRTGLADIAGICTMQIPDTVALCFAMNHQNIDGVAKVAAAIHTKRGDAVTLRAVPMRVARRDSADASDAQARAASALTSMGALTLAHVQADMEVLSIPLEDNLPFYETLAPFIAKDPALDPLTLTYLRLAKNLLDQSFVVPAFNQETLARVKQRLLPRKATMEYLATLSSAEPMRAVEELRTLFEGAVATLNDGGELDAAYLEKLGQVGTKTLIQLMQQKEGSKLNVQLIGQMADQLISLHNVSRKDKSAQLKKQREISSPSKRSVNKR
jgi:MinD-like ATPase involved in chromosome partitioning or flagellar assembly